MPATVDAPAESIVSKLGSLTAADLLALKQLLGVETPTVVVEDKRRETFNPDANLPPDRPLETPITFWNAKYPQERITVPGRATPSRFWGGTFQAKTERELNACRGMGIHVHEGDDLVNSMECPTCHIKTSNTKFFMEHVGLHAK